MKRKSKLKLGELVIVDKHFWTVEEIIPNGSFLDEYILKRETETEIIIGRLMLCCEWVEYWEK